MCVKVVTIPVKIAGKKIWSITPNSGDLTQDISSAFIPTPFNDSKNLSA
jgi:hypothetical protein